MAVVHSTNLDQNLHFLEGLSHDDTSRQVFNRLTWSLQAEGVDLTQTPGEQTQVSRRKQTVELIHQVMGRPLHIDPFPPRYRRQDKHPFLSLLTANVLHCCAPLSDYCEVTGV